MIRILVIHGPNLNLLGKREPEIYGVLTLDEVNTLLYGEAKSLGVELLPVQSNSEGEIVTSIQQAMGKFDGIVINPGAYTHTSVAIRDAIASTGIPVVEVHLSNIHKREKFRRKSFISGVAIGIVSGLGTDSYLLGLRGIVSHLKKKNS